jgi:hypothetical protein
VAQGGQVVCVALPTTSQEVHEYLSRFSVSDPDRPEFLFEATAANGLAARLIAARQHARTFLESIRTDPAPSVEVSVQQEADIYGFSCNGVSAMSCSFLLAYGIGHELNVSLPWGTAARLYPRDVESQFRQYFPKEPVTAVMTAIIKSGELAHLQGMRNALDHRSALRRGVDAGPDASDSTTLYLTVDDLDNTIPTGSPPALDIDLVTRTSELLEWLERSLDKLLGAALDLVSRR